LFDTKRHCNVKSKPGYRLININYKSLEKVKKEKLLATSIAGNFTESPALRTNNSSIIVLSLNYFEEIWKKTEDVCSKKRAKILNQLVLKSKKKRRFELVKNNYLCAKLA
jgi:hypothetical protein